MRNAGVGIGNSKYNKNTTNKTISKGEAEFMDGNFMGTI